MFLFMILLYMNCQKLSTPNIDQFLFDFKIEIVYSEIHDPNQTERPPPTLTPNVTDSDGDAKIKIIRQESDNFLLEPMPSYPLVVQN